jgi:hypothetical protein
MFRYFLLMARLLFLFCFLSATSHGDGLLNLPPGPDRLLAIKRMAEAGDPHAQKEYADHLKQSLNYAAAEYWYKSAAVHGDPATLCALGELYHENRGFGTNAIKAKLKEALQLHRLAALQGFPRSHTHVAHAYLVGNQVPRNSVLAYTHFKLAGQSIVNDLLINKLIVEMTPAQIADAEAQIKSFKPIPFRQAFELLALDSVVLGAIIGNGNERLAIINGCSVKTGSELKLEIGGLPAKVKCESVDKNGALISIGSTRKNLTVRQKIP